jgi:hypothetical protein
MTLLRRSLNFHNWLDGAFSKHHSSISLPRQFIFSKDHNAGSTQDGVHTTVRFSEWSNSLLGEPMFPLQRCPIQSLSKTPMEACFQGGRRPILGPLSRSRKRYSRKQRRIFFQKMESTSYDIPFEFQRDSWRRLLKKISK